MNDTDSPMPDASARPGFPVPHGSAKWELLMPGQWVLSLPGDAMAAMVTEGLPGRWLWQAQGKEGTAASREDAIASAEAHLPNTQVTNAGAKTENSNEH